MAKCNNCGFEFEASKMNFCPNCGQELVKGKPSKITVKVKSKKSDTDSKTGTAEVVQCCTNCQSTDLSETKKTDFEMVFNMVMGFLLLNLIGALIGFLYSNRERKYWNCNSCHQEFLMPFELEKIIEDYQKLSKVFYFFQIAFWILGGICSVMVFVDFSFIIYGAIMIGWGFVYKYIVSIINDRVKKYQDELDAITASKATVAKVKMA